jgi:hypothetical protein
LHEELAMPKRGVRAIGATLLLLCGAYAAVEVVGARALTRYDERWSAELQRTRRALREYTRPVIADAPRDDNAARWYQLAFAGLHSDRSKIDQTLFPILEGAEHVDSEERARLFRDLCGVTGGAPVGTAMACLHCDWALPYGTQTQAPPDDSAESVALAECLALGAATDLDRGDLGAAADAYSRTFLFSTDLGQGSLAMNAVGLEAAQWALRGFVRTVGRVDDARLLEDVSGEFARVSTRAPSVQVGLRQAELTAALLAGSQARASAPVRRAFPANWLPETAVAVWTLLRREKVVETFPLLGATADAIERARMADELGLPKLTSMLSQQDEVTDLVAVERMSVILQGWHIVHHEYPSALPAGAPNPRRLQYLPYDGHAGYEIRRLEAGGKPLSLYRSSVPQRAGVVDAGRP